MSAAANASEARQYDPRKEQQARLVDAAQRLGTRLAESMSAAMDAWLGSDLGLQLSGTEIAYGPRSGQGMHVSLGLRKGAAPLRLVADAGLFYRYYECMLSGPVTGEAVARPLGPTEATLGAELGARWIGCIPGFSPRPKAADVWVMDSADAPPLPGSVWPLLKLSLSPASGGDSRLEILAPLSLLEGAAVSPGAAATSSPPARRLGQTPVRLQAVLGTVRLRLKELYELRPGDCVLLEAGPADEAVVLLSREPVFRARPGRNGRHIAVQLLGTLDKKNGG